jgi:hypothetical protein
MTTQDFRSIMERATYPVEIKTTGGNTYEVPDPQAYWVPSGYPNVVFVSLPNKGVPCIKIAAIEAIEVEHAALR